MEADSDASARVAPRSGDVRAMTIAELAQHEGREIGASPWVPIDQAMFDAYATITGDHGFVHVDEAEAQRAGFPSTIAHGLLTLSLAANIGEMAKAALPVITDRQMLLNYGFERVRFVTPVPRGSRLRARYLLQAVTARSANERLLRYGITVDIEGNERPALIADWLLMVVLK